MDMKKAQKKINSLTVIALSTGIILTPFASQSSVYAESDIMVETQTQLEDIGEQPSTTTPDTIQPRPPVVPIAKENDPLIPFELRIGTTPLQVNQPTSYLMEIASLPRTINVGEKMLVKVPMGSGEHLSFTEGQTIKLNGKNVSVEEYDDEGNIILKAVENILAGTKLTIQIPEEVGIRTPTSSGNYFLGLQLQSNRFIAKKIVPVRENLAASNIPFNITAQASTLEINKSVGYDITVPSLPMAVSEGDYVAISIPVTAGDLFDVTQPNLIMINGKKATSVEFDNQGKIILKIPQEVQKGGNIRIQIPENTGLKTPTKEGSYSLGVQFDTNKASGIQSLSFKKQTEPAPKPEEKNPRFSFQLSVGTSRVDTNTDFKFYISSVPQIVHSSDIITVEFPNQNGMLPNSISRNDVRINNQIVDSVFVNRSNGTIEIRPSNTIEKGKSLSIEFNKNAGIYTPSREGTYNFRMRLPNNSTVENNSIRFYKNNDYKDSKESGKLKVSLSSQEVDTEVSLNFDFDFDKTVRIKEGGIVTLSLDGFTVPSINKADIEIDGKTPKDISVSRTKVKITIPQSIEGNVSDLDIKILKDAKVKTPKTAKKYIISGTVDAYRDGRFVSVNVETDRFEIKEKEKNTDNNQKENPNNTNGSGGVVNNKPVENPNDIGLPPAKSVDIILRLGSKFISIDKKIKTMENAPYVKNNNTMIPVRYVVEALGIDITWDDNRKQALMYGIGKTMVVKANSKEAMVDNKKVILPTTPEMKNGRLIVPLRFITESFECKVDWDKDTKMITIKR